MDIDKLFKVPKIPIGGNKRRMPDAPSPEMLKRMRLEAESAAPAPQPAPSTSAPKRVATVQDAEEDDDEEGGAGGEDFAPGGDADYFAEEDDEGRFFGGGLTSEQKEILNIFDSAEGGAVPDDTATLSPAGIKKLLLRLERAANLNQAQRSKYPDDPTKFIDSEADLDAAIKALLPLAQVPKVAYPLLIGSGQLEALVGLLSHENADIALDIVELVHELTDEDVGEEADEDEEDEDDPEEREAALKSLIDALLDYSLLELLVDNMTRFNEAEEADRQGIYHILGIFENFVGSKPPLAERLVLKTKLLPWLLERVQSKTHDENRGYAAELLSILLQDSQPNRLELGKKDGVETLLGIASQFRRRDPVDAEEAEFMENVFDSLCSALAEAEIKKLFLKSEGVDLMVLMMKDKMQARSRSVKALDHAMSGQEGTEACETFVEASGLKYLFSAFMGKPTKKQKSSAQAAAPEDTTHTLGILSSLFTNLPSDAPARIRLLTKFVESNYEKTDKLLDIRTGAQTRLAAVDREIAAEKEAMLAGGEEAGPEEADGWYLRRLDGGLYTLQTVDYILAWIIMEDDGIRAHARQMLDRRSKSLADIVATLRVFQDNIDEADARESGALSQREILGHLMAFLESC
ncbi:Catenin-beta-like protein [Gloeopeniophorella convolvens]|nr:Catenin-beta-like protein [Gloeopeniophorella convolvens]